MDIKKIRIDEFIKAVVDSKSLSEVIYLEGYIGVSSEANHVRVFFDRALNDFIDIDSDDIVYALPNSKEEDPLGGSKLWVKAKASFKYGDPQLKKRPEGSFMEGEIYEAYRQQYEQAARQVTPGQLPTNQMTPCNVCAFTPGIPCQGSWRNCIPIPPSVPIYRCPSLWISCPGTLCCITKVIHCPTRTYRCITIKCSPLTPCCRIPGNPYEDLYDQPFNPY